MESIEHDPLDLPYLRDALGQVFAPIADSYFRPRVLGAWRLPNEGPLVLACNHSGTAFPYDGIILDATLWRRDGLAAERKFRSMFDKGLAQRWWMRPFGIDNFWRRAGGVDQTFDNFDELLARGNRVIYYPEGVPGIAKGFQRRYQLQPFRTSFVLLAARHDAPVYPVYIVNGEWVMPFNFTWPPLDRFMQAWFGVPFLPLPLGAILPLLLPFTWYLAFPARLVFAIGKPIDMAARLRGRGVSDASSVDHGVARKVADDVRAEMQAELRRYVRRYGRWPFQWRLLKRRLATSRRGVWSTLPFAWAVSARVHERNRRRPPARNRLHAILRDWDLAGFYVPVFGWVMLAVARRFRRPPCGYRGLHPDTRRELEGAFSWDLRHRPLPPRESEHGDEQGMTQKGEAPAVRRPGRASFPASSGDDPALVSPES
jgi:1-acyl-sn-glycerol-3-phosphate acyltransferase